MAKKTTAKLNIEDEVVISALINRIKELKEAGELFEECNERKKDYLIDQEAHYRLEADEETEQRAGWLLDKGITLEF